MSLVSLRTAMPFAGKAALAAERARTLVAIIPATVGEFASGE